MADEHSTRSCGITVRFVSAKLEDGKFQLSAIINDESPPINICKTNELLSSDLERIAEAFQKNAVIEAKQALNTLAHEFANPLFAFLARRFCDR